MSLGRRGGRAIGLASSLLAMYIAQVFLGISPMILGQTEVGFAGEIGFVNNAFASETRSADDSATGVETVAEKSGGDTGEGDENDETDDESAGSVGEGQGAAVDDLSENDAVKLPSLYIKAINPGYKVDGKSNVNEFIELRKSGSDVLGLENISLRYTGSGAPTILLSFVEGTRLEGENLVLRLESSPTVQDAIAADGDFASVANTVYSTTLAMAGQLEIVYTEGETETVLDAVKWTSGKNAFYSTTPTVLVRDEETDRFSYLAESEYAPQVNKSSLFVPTIEGSDATEKVIGQCGGLEFSEILTYYSEEAAEQFVEVYNAGDEVIPLTACYLRYKNKLHVLATNETALYPGKYFAYRPDGFTLTKNPNTENIYELVDAAGAVVNTATIKHGQKAGTSWALVKTASGKGEWRITYKPTPGEANVYQQFRTCAAGKVINPATGNCVNIAASDEAKECPEGKYRNPLTGRCKNYDTSSKSTACPAGKYRNPLTGRCKSYATASEQKPCKEGYERNPETGRCRKMKDNSGADYGLVPITGTEEKSSFVAMWAMVGLGVIGGGYVVWQFRGEIGYFVRKVVKK